MLTLTQASDLVRRRDVSPVELTQACLARIERYDQTINAFITVTRERTLTAGVRDVEVPAVGNVATVWNPEIYAYHLPWNTKTPELYQPPTRDLIQGAGKASAATYAQARRDVDVVRQEIKKVFATVDVLITPTQRDVAQLITPLPPAAAGRGGRGGAPPAGGGGGGIVNTAAFDIYGLPTMTVPCGVSSTGLPIGLQISANHFAESTVLALAHAFEPATGTVLKPRWRPWPREHGGSWRQSRVCREQAARVRRDLPGDADHARTGRALAT